MIMAFIITWVAIILIVLGVGAGGQGASNDEALAIMYKVEAENGWFDPKEKSFKQWKKEIRKQ